MSSSDEPDSPSKPPHAGGGDGVIDVPAESGAKEHHVEKEHEVRRLLLAGLLANFLLFVGGTLYVAFYARELVVPWWTRDAVGDALYLAGFGSFFASGCIEFMIDARWTRNFGHGRYSLKKKYNIAISLLFLAGNVGDLIAFLFWRQGRTGIRAEQITQWVSTNVFLVTAILVIATNRPKYIPFQNRMDSAANVFFLVEAVLACASRYVALPIGSTARNITELNLELASACFLLGSAALYILADLIRLKHPDDVVQKAAPPSSKAWCVRRLHPLP